MYRCNECGELFETPRIYETTYEMFYGISDDIPSSTYLRLEICPHCGEEDFEEMEEEYEFRT